MTPEIVVAIATAFVSVIGSIASAVVAIMKQRADNRLLQREIDDLKEDLATKQAEIEELKRERDECRADNKALKDRVAELERRQGIDPDRDDHEAA